MGIKKEKWNEETIQKYLDDNGYDLKLIKIFWLQKSYQKQKWVTLKCKNDNHPEYDIWWNNLKRDREIDYNYGECPECKYDRTGIITWNKEKVINFYNNFGLEITEFESEWKDVDKCLTCIDENNYKFRRSITSIKQSIENGQSNSSFRFNKLNPYSLENIKTFIKNNKLEYEIVDDVYKGIKAKHKFNYIGNDLPTSIDTIFYTTIDGFVNGGTRHPYFGMPKAEWIFKELLEEYNVSYEFQKSFKDLKNQTLLFFDYYLTDFELMVELDGSNHTFSKYTITNDKIKNNYCIKNNIDLIRIKYNNENLKDFRDRCVKFLDELTI